jgi:PAS domain S-box-containing protein
MKYLLEAGLDALILENISDAIIICDREFSVVSVNRGFEEIFGYTPAEITGKPVKAFLDTQAINDIQENKDQLLKEKRMKVEMSGTRKDTMRVDLDAQINMVCEAGREEVCYILILQDVTQRNKLIARNNYTIREMEFANSEMYRVNEELENEVKLRKRAEEELRNQKQLLEKLNADLKNMVKAEVEANREKDRMMVVQSRQAAMGEIIESVAHQWKQPLNSISLLMYEIEEFVKHGRGDLDVFEQRVEEIYQMIEYMASTIDDFRNFFTPGRETGLFDAADSLVQASKFLDAEFRHSGIKLFFDLEKEVLVNGFRNEFAQVVLNILNNAKDAFSEKAIEERIIRISLKKTDRLAEIIISDNAGGIPEHMLPELFDAYVSTKHGGKGSGLGLYIARSIIEKNMQGRIMAENGEDGARFIMRLPLAEERLAESDG